MQNSSLVEMEMHPSGKALPKVEADKKLYSVYDEKTENFSPPFQAVSHGDAIRQFEGICKNPETLISRHPGDFKLYYLGGLDARHGFLVPNDKPVLVASAVDYVNTLGVQAVPGR